MTSGPPIRTGRAVQARIRQRGPRGRTAGSRGGPVRNPGGTVVNQWSSSIGQGTTFTTIVGCLQSCVVQLNSTDSVGGGTGTPTQGNWLFCIASWTQAPSLDVVHVGVSDDGRDWWRQYPASQASGNTRTAIAYTCNIGSPDVPLPTQVYVAPDDHVAALTVLVIEVTGLGPWDTVGTGYPVSNYAAAATSLSLAGGAPGAASFILAGVGGDSTAATQAFAPAGWTKLATVSQSNGSDQLASSYLTSAYITPSSGSVSVSASAGVATDLSGFLIAVYTAASSPVPAAQNPAWPYLFFEAAFGSGYNTPVSEMTWTDLTSRLWDWDGQGGIQFQLGQIQSSQYTLTLDNFDGNLTSTNPGSPYYSNALNSNMSFQSGISPWTPQNGAVIAQSSAIAYASAPGAVAQYSMQLTPDGVTATPNGFCENVPISQTGTYSGSAWFWCQNGYATGAKVTINWFDASHSYLSTSSAGAATALPAGVWTQVELLGQSPPANAAYANIACLLSGTPSAATVAYIAEAALVAGNSAVSTGLVTPGTPVRIRAALGTIGGVTVNRWYVLALNAAEWIEKIDEAYRRYVSLSATDLWAALSATPPTFYRATVIQDSPYAWWPCDDQPGTAGVLPTALLNAALGNTNTLNVVLSPNGGTVQNHLTTSGINTNQEADATKSSGYPPGVAIYTTGANGGWMFGDPQSTASSISAAGNPVQSTPGSASWQASGQAGSTGSYGWFLSCNDANFPVLANGVTIEIWFNAAYYASANGWLDNPVAGQETFTSITGQPYNTQLTLWEIATGSNPVCELYLDASGHLILDTFNGASGTTHNIYTSSDLRSNSWHMVTVTLTTTTWHVWLDGGTNANVSGSATGMTSAWTWFIANGDFGANGGSSAGTGLVHGGNVALSHIAIYPVQLPYYRILDHYWAAVSAFGQLPAPSNVQIQWLEQPLGPFSAHEYYLFTGIEPPDGSAIGFNNISGVFTGYSYTSTTGVSVSVVVAATAGSTTSGPSAWVTGATNYFSSTGTTTVNSVALWISWTGLAPSFNVYTSASLGGETGAAVVNGLGDSFSSGYGNSASGHGVAQTGSGSGASPPTSASSVGDTVAQRIERLMHAGLTTSPNRCIDPASLLVQAPGSQGGGLQAGAAIQQIQQSDSGMLYVDAQNNLTYWQRSHLAAQYTAPVWALGTDAGEIPYWREAEWVQDPQQILNVITVQPISPTGAALPEYTPANVAGVEASQEAYGAQPYAVTSWLQDTTEMQAQADWIFTNYGTPRRRTESIKIDAASHPAAWPLVLGASVGDVLTVRDWQIGGGGPVHTYRILTLRRHIEFGGPDGREVVGAVWILAGFEPPSYWT